MTPKEKAKELVFKYESKVTHWDCYYDVQITVENRLPDMKECALIAVDEIIKEFGTYYKIQYDNKYVSYWESVKLEIQKL